MTWRNEGPRGGAFLLEPVTQREPFILEDFGPDDLHFAEVAESFVEKEVLPHTDAIERQEPGLMPRLLKRAGELGLLMLEVPTEYGGLGASKAAALLVAARACSSGSFTVAWNAHVGIGTLPLVLYGSDEQRARYLPKLATGEWIAAYALSEPGSGSDALGAKTRAVPSADGQSYRLNGVKQFITNAGFADLFTVFAKVDGEKFTAFLIERTYAGVGTGPEEHKLGIKGSSTRQLILEDVDVPAANVLGTIGAGHKIAFNILNIGRLKLGGLATAGAARALSEAIQYAVTRKQFQTPIVQFGAIQRKIADMAARIYAAESVTYRTVGLLDAGAATLDEHDE
ncbi:MAG TPA: acyl-CoA dehydrogenase family protein, partial [Candidatus Kryptonia bacterium]|nr:acyl-CoA dehydrogenase family protein [Candidatus Kryptonia bacterium]